MEKLVDIAIIYIYPDGTVEKIPIKDGWSCHMLYMEEQVKNSLKFRQIIGDYRFISKLHDEVDERLALNGVVSILNLDLEDIAKGLFDIEIMPIFWVLVPSLMHSLEQTLTLEEFYNYYPKQNLVCECFNEELDGYLRGKEFDMNSYLEEAKKAFGIKSL